MKNAKREAWNFIIHHLFCVQTTRNVVQQAYYEYKNGITHGWDLNAIPNLKLGERYE